MILKQVPADVCQNCGEYSVSESVTAEVLQKGEECGERRRGSCEIIRYVA
ncbi:MAG UNVERIFIED_CONTAM: YgiT-type zinc finger protein [Microcystis novacekii LVE1205-3]